MSQAARDALPRSAAPALPRVPRRWRRWALVAVVVVGVGLAVWRLLPLVVTALTTVSTDDAYVAGHVTFVAPRVSGQVVRVLVDDTQQVRTGDLLVELDRQPYQIQYDLKAAVVAQARADLKAAEANARATEATARSNRWRLQSAIEQVANQVALLNARVAALSSQQAILARARADLDRAERLRKSGSISKEEVDQRQQAFRVAEAQTREAEQQVYQTRVGLGLPARPPADAPLNQVPADIEQTFSGVRVALADLVQSAAQLGLPLPASNETPRHYLDRFYHNPKGEPIEKLLEELVTSAPVVLQARAKLAEAEHDLEQAKLNLSYCEVRAEVNGVVSRRNVNPGNNVQVGQQLMAVRSLTEIWVDANFKETQLDDLKVGLPVDLYVDTYGDRVVFRARVAGFSPGTGSTLALLPPENATGNFVKVVQRLPVRIELAEPPPPDAPLFVGLSVVPYVRYRETPTGPGAGQKLQAARPVTREPAASPQASPPSAAGPVATPHPPRPTGATVPSQGPRRPGRTP